MIRAIRNTHIPVNRLLPEARDCEQDLVAATHACQYWRFTLTSSPSLWTRLRFLFSRDVDRTLTYLERSKLATIDIQVAAAPLPEPETLKHFAPHISRTKSFGPSSSKTSMWLPHSRCAAPPHPLNTWKYVPPGSSARHPRFPLSTNALAPVRQFPRNFPTTRFPIPTLQPDRT